MMKTFFPVLTGLALIGAGVAAMCFDEQGARLYGLPTKDHAGLGFVKATGARDLTMGVMLLAAPRAGRSLLFATSLVAIFDYLNVSMNAEEAQPRSLAIHGSGIAALLIFAMLTPRGEA